MPSESRLTVEVMGGLCSRLRAVIGAMAWCKANNAKLSVNWPSHEKIYPTGFEARLSDLWDYGDSIQEFDRIQRFKKDSDRLKSPGDHSIRTCHIEDFLPWVYDRVRECMTEFPLSVAVRGYLGTVLDVLTCLERVVGVHIRYDIPQPGTASPEWFIDRMSVFPEDVKFYLSCDSKDVSRRIHGAFPRRVVEMDKTYRYDRAGIQKSMADLHILSSTSICKWVIGANHSSYSQMACLMRGGKYIGPHDRPNGVQSGMYEDMWNPPSEEVPFYS